MNLDLAYDELLPQPPETVWTEITEASAISDWLMPTEDFRPEVGCRFRLQRAPGVWISAVVLEMEPPRHMVWSWSHNEGSPPSIVTFDLVPDPSGTRLLLSHRGEARDDEADALRRGWPSRIAELAALGGQG